MDDIRVLKHARHYIASMADGINPLTGEYAPPGDTISQERIQKCCAYVTDILNKLIESGGSFKPKKIPFSITQQQLTYVQLSQQPIAINDFAKRINAVTPKNMRGISGAKITSWLAKNGYLDVAVSKSTQIKEVTTTKKVLNNRSRELGISSVQTTNRSTGEIYEKLLYNESAQKFILNNLDKINLKS